MEFCGQHCQYTKKNWDVIKELDTEGMKVVKVRESKGSSITV
jgi:hypothetical protein